MARVTMSWIIATLREKIFDRDATIWNDDQLQLRLDTHRTYIDMEKLNYTIGSGIYRSSYMYLEGLPTEWSGSGNKLEVINLWKDIGATSYVVPNKFNLVDGIFIFEADQGDLYLTGYSYDIYLTISDILLELANDPDAMINWSRGNVSITYYNLLDLSERYRNLSLIGARIIESGK